MSIKEMLVVFVVVLMGLGVSFVQAEEVVAPIGLEVTSEVMTDYDFYGYDAFGDKTVWRVGATYELPKLPILGRGAFAGISSLGPVGDGFEKRTRVDYTVGYNFILMKDTPLQINATTAYTLLDLVKSDNDDDIHRATFTAALPNVIKVLDIPLVPSIQVVRLESDNEDGDNKIPAWIVTAPGVTRQTDFVIDGTLVIAGLDYSVPVLSQELDLSAKAVYNDGIAGSPAGTSHFALKASTDLKINDTLTLTPYASYFIHQEDSIEDEDSFGGGVCLKAKF